MLANALLRMRGDEATREASTGPTLNRGNPAAEITRWRSPATDAASAPTSMESPFSIAGNRQQAPLSGGTIGYDYAAPTDPFRRRYGGDGTAAMADGGSSVPSVASAPSLLQSGPAGRRDHNPHARHRGPASLTWSNERTPGFGGGGGVFHGGWTPGRKRPRTQPDHAAGSREGLAGGGSLDADRDGRPSTTPRKLGKRTRRRETIASPCTSTCRDSPSGTGHGGSCFAARLSQGEKGGRKVTLCSCMSAYTAEL